MTRGRKAGALAGIVAAFVLTLTGCGGSGGGDKTTPGTQTTETKTDTTEGT